MKKQQKEQQKLPNSTLYQRTLKAFEEYKTLDSCNKGLENLFLQNPTLEFLQDHPLIKDPSSEVLFRIQPTEDLGNLLGTLHGATVSLLVDTLSSIAGMGYSSGSATDTSVTINLTTQNIRPLHIGKDLYLLARVKKLGRKLIFLNCEIYDHELRLAALGSHEKMRVDSKSLIEKKLKAAYQKLWLEPKL